MYLSQHDYNILFPGYVLVNKKITLILELFIIYGEDRVSLQ
jgi:hypothetical protein